MVDNIFFMIENHNEFVIENFDEKIRKALEMGEMMNQQSIYGWAPRKKGQLVWCE